MLLAQAPVQISSDWVRIGSVLAAAIYGIWVVRAAGRKGRPRLGILSFLACLASEVLIGVGLALPTAIVLRLLICTLDKVVPPGLLEKGLAEPTGEPVNPYTGGKRSAFGTAPTGPTDPAKPTNPAPTSATSTSSTTPSKAPAPVAPVPPRPAPAPKAPRGSPPLRKNSARVVPMPPLRRPKQNRSPRKTPV